MINVSYINFHFPIQPIVEQEVVGHSDSVGFHGMTLAIVVIPNIPWGKKIIVLINKIIYINKIKKTEYYYRLLKNELSNVNLFYENML